MKITWNDELYHYGMPRRSGRYKWGSGKDPYHHGADGGRIKRSKKEKYTAKAESAAAKGKKNKYVKNFNKAIKEAEKENDSYKKSLKEGTFLHHPHSTGKEFDKVHQEYRKELNDYETSYFDKHPDVQKELDNGNDYLPDADKYFKGYDDIMDKYGDRFKEAALKDIGYKDVQKGMKLYKKYKIGYWGVY